MEQVDHEGNPSDRILGEFSVDVSANGGPRTGGGYFSVTSGFFSGDEAGKMCAQAYTSHRRSHFVAEPCYRSTNLPDTFCIRGEISETGR